MDRRAYLLIIAGFSLLLGIFMDANAQQDKAMSDESARERPQAAGSRQPDPRIIFNPGPEYADENRFFGIASSIARSPGGRLWCGWSSGGTQESQENYCIVVTSDDDGQSWTPPRIVIDAKTSKGKKIRTDHLTAWTAPTGDLWLMWSEYPRGLTGPDSSLWCIVSKNPNDKEPRWSEPRKLIDGQNLLTTPVVLRDGSWIFPTGCWRRKSQFPSRPIISHDAGKTFVLGGPLHGGLTDFDEYMIVERANGDLVVYNRYGTSFLTCESSDQGQTWTAQKPDGLPHTNSRFVFMVLQSGHWLLVKHGSIRGISDARETKHPENKGRSHLTAFVSMDEGKTWTGGLMLDERPCSYPFGCQASDGTIYVSYERNRWDNPEILLARFTEADVLAGKVVSNRARLRLIVNRATGESKR
jgi:hypothetical protein